MRFIIEFSVDNAAFTEGNRKNETIRVLERVIRDMKNDRGNTIILDVNGNKIGVFGFRV